VNIFNQVKHRVSIVKQIEKYIPLEYDGSTSYYKGLCTFCIPNDSKEVGIITINPEKGIYHCNKCFINGDTISFEAKKRGCSILDAAKVLYEEHGMNFKYVTWDY